MEYYGLDIYPMVLQSVIDVVKYKPGWSFNVMGFAGSARGLNVRIETINSITGEQAILGHQFSIPRNAHLWTREQCEEWVLRRILDVETHEACEFFRIEDQRPYFPGHGPEATSLYKVIRRKAG